MYYEILLLIVVFMYLFCFLLCYVDVDFGCLVIWIVSVLCLIGLFGDVIFEFDCCVCIEQINFGFEEVVDVIGQCLCCEYCDVVIVGGFNVVWLCGRLELLLVLIQVNGFDLMEVLVCVCCIVSCIGLVIYVSDVFVFSNFQQSFGLDIEYCCFVICEDVCDCIVDLCVNGIEVIVGIGMVIDYVEQVGLFGVLLYLVDLVW